MSQHHVEHSVNLYVVRRVAPEVLAFGLPSHIQQSAACTARLKAFSRSGIGDEFPTSTDSQPNTVLPQPPHSVDMEMTEARVGMVAQSSAFLRARTWELAYEAAHTVAHELGHVCNLSHYRGGEIEPRTSGVQSEGERDDLWAHKNMMYNRSTLAAAGWPATSTFGSREVDYGDIEPGFPAPGLALTIKGEDYQSTTAPRRDDVIPSSRQASLIRSSILRQEYFGHPVVIGWPAAWPSQSNPWTKP